MSSEVKSLQEEIRQTKPFPSVELEVFLAVLRTAGVLEQKQAHSLRTHGLTGTQYNTLRILRGAGEAALTCSDIGERACHARTGRDAHPRSAGDPRRRCPRASPRRHTVRPSTEPVWRAERRRRKASR